MRLFDRYLFESVYTRFVLVLLGFVGMFSFFDLVAEVGQLGRSGYRLEDALTYVFFRIPSVCYELTPLSALIGGLWAMADLASSSEFTVARASGYRPVDAVLGVLIASLPLAAAVLILSELVMPWSDARASQARAPIGSAASGQALRSGYWLKDNLVVADARVSERYINLGQSMPKQSVRSVRIYEFDASRRMSRYIEADTAEFASLTTAEGQLATAWKLKGVRLVDTFEDGSARSTALPLLEFQSGVSPETLDALLVRPEQMAAHQLWRYVDYLEAGKQKTSRYELALWRKMSYPIGVMAMLLLALPIAYVQTRSGYLGLKVFAGIGVGLAFHLLNNLFSHLTTLGDWPAAAVALTPSLIAMLLALSVLQMAQRRAL